MATALAVVYSVDACGSGFAIEAVRHGWVDTDGSRRGPRPPKTLPMAATMGG